MDLWPSVILILSVVVALYRSYSGSAEHSNIHCEISLPKDPLPFAQVSGCDVKDLVAAGRHGATLLTDLIITHGLLIFRGQDLSPAEELAANKMLAWHSSVEGNAGFSKNASRSPPTLPLYPEVLCQGNAALHDHHGLTTQLNMTLTYNNEGFHSDGVHNLQTDLPIITSMYNIQAPVHGGNTFFGCGRLAFQRASPEIQVKARRLYVHYAYSDSWGLPIMQAGIIRVGRESPRGLDQDMPVIRTVHPLVRRHPETGEESLYVSTANIDHMEAEATDNEPELFLDTKASYVLIETLLSDITRSPLVYAHEWKQGDFVMWDNRLTLHAPGEPTKMEGVRLHHRVRLPGSQSANRDLTLDQPVFQ